MYRITFPGLKLTICVSRRANTQRLEKSVASVKITAGHFFSNNKPQIYVCYKLKSLYYVACVTNITKPSPYL